MTRKRLLYLIAVGTVLGVFGASIMKDRDAREVAERGAQRAEHTAAPPAAHMEKEPMFIFPEGLEKKRRSMAEAALTAVYDRCSRYAVFREGSRLEAEHVPSGDEGPEGDDVVAVSVKVPDMARTRGNTLWYQVWFVGGRPTTMLALKPISAELCGFAAPENPERIQ